MKPIFLTRTEPAKNIDRFYTLRVTPTLFGEWALLREWGRRLRQIRCHDEEPPERI